MRKVSTCLVLALVGGALLAGCGSGSKSTSNSASSSTATVTTGSPSSGVSGTKGSSAAGSTHPLTPKQIVEDCKRIVGAPSALTAAQKEKLLKSCAKAPTGPAAQHEVIRELCLAVASRQPNGASKERLLAVCRQLK
ncbi:MAG: hypothetical protein E6F96_02045 [Actinobacteria bacterium]|nr:MAG: hypothetical protein E6F96_02045 [Actinomycetota bacterium]